MKINRHNTALHFLATGKMQYAICVPNEWGKPKEDHFRYMIETGFPNKREFYKKKVQYISDPFLLAYEDVKDRIKLDLRETRLEDSGTFIMRRPDGGRNTVFYTVSISDDAQGATELRGNCIIFGTDPANQMKIPVLMLAYMKTTEGQPFEYIHPQFPGRMGWMSEKEPRPFEMWLTLLYMVIFMRYCEVETKVVNAGKKGDHVGTKYINETDQAIEIVDSTWFTTIIRSEGFGVKGHFRLQPYPSLNTKKLIYIAPFEKKGYTRKAKVLTQKPSNEQTETAHS